MKKILFPTDFSETSLNAFVYALALAKNINAEIITLHVYQLPIMDHNYIELPIYISQVYESVDLSNFENFKDQIPALRAIAEKHKMNNIKLSNVLLEGDLVQNILEIVTKEKIDFVVMGTKGANGIKEIFLGSSTASVMSGSNAIVLGIPEASVYEPIKRIAFTTKFTDQDAIALRKLIDIAKNFNAHIDCLYIKNANSEDNSVFKAQWISGFANEKIAFHTIESNDVEDTIIDFIALHKINVLAILNQERSFFESLFHQSLTRKLAFHIKVPLMALHN